VVASTRLFWILTVFFAILAAVYTVWSVIDHNNTATVLQRPSAVEWAGTIALALVAILSALIAFYLGRSYSAQGGELPEDRLNANIDDGDAEQGFFSPWSWWPIMLAGGGAVLFLGVAAGVWIALIGAALTLISLVGWMFEYYRGNFGR
jgi:hypothetical protein